MDDHVIVAAVSRCGGLHLHHALAVRPAHLCFLISFLLNPQEIDLRRAVVCVSAACTRCPPLLEKAPPMNSWLSQPPALDRHQDEMQNAERLTGGHF